MPVPCENAVLVNLQWRRLLPAPLKLHEEGVAPVEENIVGPPLSPRQFSGERPQEAPVLNDITLDQALAFRCHIHLCYDSVP